MRLGLWLSVAGFPPLALVQGLGVGVWGNCWLRANVGPPLV